MAKVDVQVGFRVTPGERALLVELVRRRQEDTGDGSASSWFRALLRATGKAAGLSVVEPVEGEPEATGLGGLDAIGLAPSDRASEDLPPQNAPEQIREYDDPKHRPPPRLPTREEEDAEIARIQAKLEEKRRQHEQEGGDETKRRLKTRRDS